MFDLQPLLRGALVVIRPLAPTDHDALFSVASDPLIWEQHPAKQRATPEGFDEFFQDSLASGGALVVLDASTNTIIGATRFYGYSGSRSEIEIGWTFLARSYWGGRYNYDVKQLLLRHAFRFVRHVIFLVDLGNLRSQRAMEKIGGIRYGTRPNAAGLESIVFRISADAEPFP